MYLALDGVYHPLWAAFPNNPTPETLAAARQGTCKGLTPALGDGPDQEDFDAPRMRLVASHTPQFPPALHWGIRCWAISASLAVTKEILVSFFSSA